MASQLDLKIDQVVQSGTGLAFIAYPGLFFYHLKVKVIKQAKLNLTLEAMSRMPMPWLWSTLFFR